MPIESIRLVTRILEGYATNGVFRGFSVTAETRTTAKYRIVWHFDRTLDLVLSIPKRTLRFEALLTDVPPGSPMYRDFKEFVNAFHSNERPPHRRIDPAQARLRFSNRAGNMSLSVTSMTNNFDYATRKLIHAANEIFMVFLRDGPYSRYLQETLGMDPDTV